MLTMAFCCRVDIFTLGHQISMLLSLLCIIQSLEKIAILRGAIFFANLRPCRAQFFAKFANFAICLKIFRAYVFPLKFAFSVICAGLARKFAQIGLRTVNQHKIHLTHNATDSMCFMQTLLIIQRTRLYYGYHNVFLKQNREKILVATTKHLRATFGQFFADFQRIFQLSLRAILAHFQRNF